MTIHWWKMNISSIATQDHLIPSSTSTELENFILLTKCASWHSSKRLKSKSFSSWLLVFRKDLDYWLIDENWMDECCVEKYCGLRENVMEEMEITAAGLQTVSWLENVDL